MYKQRHIRVHKLCKNNVYPKVYVYVYDRLQSLTHITQ